MDNYKELQEKYEITIQENAKLKFEVQDIMEMNVTLQKALANLENELPQVNYVGNVIEHFYQIKFHILIYFRKLQGRRSLLRRKYFYNYRKLPAIKCY